MIWRGYIIRLLLVKSNIIYIGGMNIAIISMSMLIDNGWIRVMVVVMILFNLLKVQTMGG